MKKQPDAEMSRTTHNPLWLLLGSTLILASTAVAYGAWTVLEHATFDKVLPSIAEAATSQPWPVARAVAGYVGATLLAHLGFVMVLMLAWRGLLPLFGTQRRERRNLALALMVLGLAVVLLWNAALYPRSIYATGYETLTAHPVMMAIRYALTTGLLGAVLAGSFLSLRRPLVTAIKHKRYQRAVIAGTIAVMLSAVTAAGWWLANDRSVAPSAQPHVIIVGIDGLRPEVTGLLGPKTGLTPSMDAFFDASASYPNVISPMGRTYAAWTSVFTGQEPATHGRRFNLMPGDPGLSAHSLPKRLSDEGYRTIYASDSRRMANFGQRHGFDEVISPKTGISDFLIASLNDVPLNNVLLATPIGRWLFPHTYANRAADTRYYPKYFDRLLELGIDQGGEQPVFLTVNFTLPHWPYLWANSHEIETELLPEDIHQQYARAILRVDRQFARLLTQLESQGYLDNAIVVLMSGHGEENRVSQNWWEAAPGVERANFRSGAAGHGSIAISILQNRTFMAWRGYGAMSGQLVPGQRNQWTSLIDIAPTILDGLLASQPDAADGVSLWSEITEQAKPMSSSDRHLFIETGFTPPTILAGLPDLGKMVRQRMGYYDVQSDGSLTLREHIIPGLIRGKQRAVVRDGWILGLVPGRPGGTLAVLGHIDSRQWWPLDVAGDPPPPAEAPVAEMLQALCTHFVGDGDFRGHARFCTND